MRQKKSRIVRSRIINDEVSITVSKVHAGGFVHMVYPSRATLSGHLAFLCGRHPPSLPRRSMTKAGKNYRVLVRITAAEAPIAIDLEMYNR